MAVPDLSKLAAAISSQSPTIRNYAVESAKRILSDSATLASLGVDAKALRKDLGLVAKDAADSKTGLSSLTKVVTALSDGLARAVAAATATDTTAGQARTDAAAAKAGVATLAKTVSTVQGDVSTAVSASAVATDEVAQLRAQVDQLAAALVSRSVDTSAEGLSWPRAFRDYGGNLQKMIDELLDGQGCLLDGQVALKQPLDTSRRNALVIKGSVGGVGFNEGARWGAIIRTDNSAPQGMPLIVTDGGATVIHSGPRIKYLTIFSTVTNTVGLKIRQSNHGRLLEVSFQGLFARAIDVDVPVSVYPSGDAAYWDFDIVTIVNLQPNQHGIHMGDGYIRGEKMNFDIAGDQCYGVKNLRGVADFRWSKWNHPGHHYYSEGAGGTLVNNDFEIYGNAVYAVEIARPPGALQYQGSRHIIVYNHYTPHDGPARLFRAGPGTYNNRHKENTTFSVDALSIVDQGDNDVS